MLKVIAGAIIGMVLVNTLGSENTMYILLTAATMTALYAIK